MKKVILMICVGAILLAISACGRDDMAGQESAASAESAAMTKGTVGTERETEREADPAANLEEVKTAVVNALGEENYWPDTVADPEILESEFVISSDMYDEYLAEIELEHEEKGGVENEKSETE